MTDEQRQLNALDAALAAASNALFETECLRGMADGKQIDLAIDRALTLVQKWRRYAEQDDAAHDPRNQWDTLEEWRGER